MKTYRVNEVFYSLQGEGARAGEPSVFVRFTGCNLQCAVEPGDKSPGGFDCDTEFMSGCDLSGTDLVQEIVRVAGACRWIVYTGGEPGLQLREDSLDLLTDLREKGFRQAIETNGSIALPEQAAFDWITVSPKVAEHAVRQLTASEVKYVRHTGQGIPRPRCQSRYRYLSPAFGPHGLLRENLEWVIRLCKENPEWRLSVQQHKGWSIR